MIILYVTKQGNGLSIQESEVNDDIIEVLVQVFILYSWYIGCCRVLEGYVANRLAMSDKVYMLQVSDGEDPKLYYHNRETHLVDPRQM